MLSWSPPLHLMVLSFRPAPFLGSDLLQQPSCRVKLQVWGREQPVTAAYLGRPVGNGLVPPKQALLRLQGPDIWEHVCLLEECET